MLETALVEARKDLFEKDLKIAELHGTLHEWRRYVRETKFNNDVLKNERDEQRDHIHQLVTTIGRLQAELAL